MQSTERSGKKVALHCVCFMLYSINTPPLLLLQTLPPRGNPRQVWLLSTGESSPEITEEVLINSGLRDGVVREIHCMKWMDVKYVLLNFDRKGRVRLQQMKSVAGKLDERLSVPVTLVTEGDRYQPVLERMMEVLEGKMERTEVQSWVKDGKEKVGFLRRAIRRVEVADGDRVEASKYRRIRSEKSALNKKLESVVQENTDLKVENTRLRENRVSALIH